MRAFAFRFRWLVEDARSYAQWSLGPLCSDADAKLSGSLAGTIVRLAHELADAGAQAEDIRALIALGLQAGRERAAA